MNRPGSLRPPVLWAGLIGILLVVVACVATNLPPIGTSPAAFIPEQDEQRLWAALRQTEEKVVPSKYVYEDERLTRYLQDLLDRLMPPSYRQAGGPSLTVRVRKDPRLNAGAMAHGLIVVNTGILARAENEAQLAAVLAHEGTHITHRHQIREYREFQNRQTAINVVGFLGLLALTAAAVDQSQRGNPGAAEAIMIGGAPLLNIGLQLTYAAMVSGYSRDLEREADENGMRLMANAGYPVREMGNFFRIMLAESSDRGPIETFFWGSHPRISERIATVEERVKDYAYTSSARIMGPEFEARLAGVRVANAQWDAYMGRRAIARSQIERTLRQFPESTQKTLLTRLLDGHFHTWASAGARSRNEWVTADLDFVRAVSLYQGVITEGSIVPGATKMVSNAYKSLGLLYHFHRDVRRTHCEAKRTLEKYLELEPSASDGSTIREKLRDVWC